MDYEKRETRKRRIARAVVCVLLLGVAWLAGCALEIWDEADAYREELQEYEAAVAEYERKMENIAVKARQAMGLKGDGWVNVTVGVKSETIDKSGNVGSDLHLYAYINGELITGGLSEAKVQVLANNEIETVLIEEDDGMDDVGTTTEYRWMEPEPLNDGMILRQDVTVYENGGKYAGSYLTKRVTYTITAVQQMDTAAYREMILPEKPKEPTGERPDLWWVKWRTAGITALILLCWYISGWRKDKAKILAAQAEGNARKEKREAKRQELLLALKEKSPAEMAGVPAKVKFDENDTPYDEGWPGRYGHFSVYCTRDGRVYHARKGCCGAELEVHIFDALYAGRRPCAMCAKKYPTSIPEWYKKYRQLKTDMKIYNIDDEE